MRKKRSKVKGYTRADGAVIAPHTRAWRGTKTSTKPRKSRGASCPQVRSVKIPADLQQELHKIIAEKVEILNELDLPVTKISLQDYVEWALRGHVNENS